MTTLDPQLLGQALRNVGKGFQGSAEALNALLKQAYPSLSAQALDLSYLFRLTVGLENLSEQQLKQLGPVLLNSLNQDFIDIFVQGLSDCPPEQAEFVAQKTLLLTSNFRNRVTSRLSDLSPASRQQLDTSTRDFRWYLSNLEYPEHHQAAIDAYLRHFELFYPSNNSPRRTVLRLAWHCSQTKGKMASAETKTQRKVQEQAWKHFLLLLAETIDETAPTQNANEEKLSAKSKVTTFTATPKLAQILRQQAEELVAHPGELSLVSSERLSKPIAVGEQLVQLLRTHSAPQKLYYHLAQDLFVLQIYPPLAALGIYQYAPQQRQARTAATRLSSSLEMLLSHCIRYLSLPAQHSAFVDLKVLYEISQEPSEYRSFSRHAQGFLFELERAWDNVEDFNPEGIFYADLALGSLPRKAPNYSPGKQNEAWRKIYLRLA